MMPRVWAITDASQDDDTIASRAEDVCAALEDRVCIHLRDKEKAGAALFDRLRAVTRAHGSLFVASIAGADGVHGTFSVSTHSDDDVRNARSKVILVSPIFETPGKGPARGLDAIRSAARITRIPIYALGGVDAGNARACIDAGAHGVAVIRAVFGRSNAGEAARALLVAIGQPQSRQGRKGA